MTPRRLLILIGLAASLLIAPVLAGGLDFLKASQKEKDPEKGIELTSKAIESEDLSPANLAKAYLYRGYFYGLRDLFRLAIADYSRALEINPSLSLAYANRGEALLHLGEYEKALADFDRAIKLKNDHRALTYAYNNRGILWNRRGQPRRALVDFNRAIELNPDRAQYYNNRGAAHRRLGEDQKALADFNKAIELSSEFANPYYNRSLIYQQQGRLERALGDARRFVELAPQDSDGPRLLRELQVQRARAREPAGPEKVGQKGPEASGLPQVEYKEPRTGRPTSAHQAEKVFAKALEAQQQGRLEGAVELYTRLIHSGLLPRRDLALVYNNRGNCHLQSGQDERALADYLQALELNPDYPLTYYNLSLYYEKQARWNEALAAAQRFVALKTDDPDGPLRLKRLRARFQRTKEVIPEKTVPPALPP